MKIMFFGVCVALLLVGFSACRPFSEFETSADAKLEFSTDTLRFDTVFTTLGSATRSFKVYNTHNLPIRISKISMVNDAFSVFNINVDGISANEHFDVEIPPNDSIYIFGEVRINPDQDISASPFVIGGQIAFETNGNTQKVQLEAWGQNANYIPSKYSAGEFSLLSTDAVWDDPKPYVIYGILFVDSCTLTLPAGCNVYIHGGLATFQDSILYNDGGIFVQPAGRIRMLGTAENPVTIRGDRLEAEFDKVRGQYWGVQLSPGSVGNIIEYAEISQGLVGVYADSSAELTIRNSKFHTTSSSGIYGRHAKIDASNCLIYDNSAPGLRVEYGGDYNFDYCTVASYGNNAVSLRLGNVQCYDEFCSNFDVYRLKFKARNCVFFGSQSDEISLFDAYQGQDVTQFDVQINNSVVRTKDLLNADNYPMFLTQMCPTCLNGVFGTELFLDTNEDLYSLDTNSVAKGYALPILGLDIDLLNKPRDAAFPDAGCFEYVE